MPKVSLTGIVVITLAMLLVFGCKGMQKTGKDSGEKKVVEKPVPVAVTPVQQRDLTESIDVTGTLQPASEVSVGPRLAGKVLWVVGKSGTRVTRGQVVIRMDETDVQIQLRSAQAAARAARARLAQAKAAVTQQQTATDTGIQNALAAVSVAEAHLKQAKTTRNALADSTAAQIRQATQALSAARSRYTTLQNGSRTQERMIAENNKRLAEATFNNDKNTYERLKMLYAKGAVSKAALDAADTKLQISQAQFDSAQQQLSLVNEGPRQEDLDAAKAAVEQSQAALDAATTGLEQVKVADDNVGIAESGVKQAKAALAMAKANINMNIMRDTDVLSAQAGVSQADEMVASARQAISNTQITSPVDGVVDAQLVENGQAVGANVTVLRISTNKALNFEAQVSELSATRLRIGQPVILSIDAMQGDRANVYKKQQSSAVMGFVEGVVPVVDARTRNFTVRVVVANNTALFPGMFARGHIQVATHPAALIVPKEAVLESDTGQFIFVVVNNVAKKIPVSLGASDSTVVQVLSGVNLGDQVVTLGQQALLDGNPVTISNATGK